MLLFNLYDLMNDSSNSSGVLMSSGSDCSKQPIRRHMKLLGISIDSDGYLVRGTVRSATIQHDLQVFKDSGVDLPDRIAGAANLGKSDLQPWTALRTKTVDLEVRVNAVASPWGECQWSPDTSTQVCHDAFKLFATHYLGDSGCIPATVPTLSK